MSAPHSLREGDHARVTFEGIYKNKGIVLGDSGYKLYDRAILSEAAAKIEKIDPPVIAFRPGDVVRWIGYPGGGTYTVAKGGKVLAHSTGTLMPAGHEVNSTRYELVELG